VIRAKRRRLEMVALTLLLPVAVYALTRLASNTIALPHAESLLFWTAGRVLLAHGNPYAPAQIKALQVQAGFSGSELPFILEPPWALPLMVPLGLLDFDGARVLWLLANSAIICSCAALAWRYYRGPRSHWALPWILTVVFAPIYQLLGLGQITAWVLLGIVGFLVAERQRRDWLAGMALGIMTIKPHIAYLIWPAVFLWMWKERRWRVAGGACTAFILLSALPLLSNRDIYSYYLQLTAQHPLTEGLDPSLSTMIRLLLGPDRWWGQWLLAVVGFAWFLTRWLRMRNRWDWSLQAPVLVVASVLTAPHTMVYDQVVLVLPLMQMAAMAVNGGSRAEALFAAGSYALVDGVVVLLVVMVSGGLPTAPGWTILYAILGRRLVPRLTKDGPAGAQTPSDGQGPAMLAE
jgi:hypothetical protein